MTFMPTVFVHCTHRLKRSSSSMLKSTVRQPTPASAVISGESLRLTEEWERLMMQGFDKSLNFCYKRRCVAHLCQDTRKTRRTAPFVHRDHKNLEKSRTSSNEQRTMLIHRLKQTLGWAEPNEENSYKRNQHECKNLHEHGL